MVEPDLRRLRRAETDRPEAMQRIRAIFREIDQRLSAFVRGQVLVILILGAWYATGLVLIGLDFGLLLFSGLIVHALFAESIHRAPYLIINHSNYVKKIVFPLEILAWTSLGSALFHAAISALVLILFYGVLHHALHWTMLLVPLLLLPLALVTIGISWFLASAGVFVRDIGQASGPVTTVMLFLSPVFYPASAFPEAYRGLLYANPLTFLITQAQDMLIWGKGPSWIGIGAYCAGSYLIAWCGLLWFQKTRKAFADVL